MIRHVRSLKLAVRKAAPASPAFRFRLSTFDFRFAGLLALVAPAPASASVADVFGLGSAYVGAGDAAVAEAQDFAACFYNPAGLAVAARPSLHLGWTVADARVHAGGAGLDLEHAGGAVFGLAVPLDLPLSWLREVAFGFALYAPPDTAVAIRGRPASEPTLPYYSDRLARWLVLPAVALRFAGDVALGVAVDLFAGIRGPVEVAEGPTGAAEGRTALELPGTATPIVGLRWDPFPSFSVGVVWRAEFSAIAATSADARAGGAAVRLDAALEGLYRPHTVVLGLAFRGTRWRAGLDASWEHWSAFDGALPDVGADWQGMGLAPQPPALPFRDAFGVRAGGEVRFVLGGAEVAVRAGYGWESRILPADVAGAALLDGDKHIVSGGLGLRLAMDDGTLLSLDAHVAAHVLAGASAVAPATDAGGDAVRIAAEGAVLSAGFDLGVEW